MDASAPDAGIGVVRKYFYPNRLKDKHQRSVHYPVPERQLVNNPPFGFIDGKDGIFGRLIGFFLQLFLYLQQISVQMLFKVFHFRRPDFALAGVYIRFHQVVIVINLRIQIPISFHLSLLCPSEIFESLDLPTSFTGIRDVLPSGKAFPFNLFSYKALRRRNIRVRIRGRISRIRVRRTCIRTCIRITACQANTKTAKRFKENSPFSLQR